MKKINFKSLKKIDKKKIWTVVLAVVFFAVTFFSGFFTYKLTLGRKMQSLNWAVEMIDKYGCYFDEEGKLIELSKEDYARLLTENLDNYSTYYTSDEYKEETEESNGNNVGIGISFSVNSNYEYSIYRVVWNSPAEKEGLKEGDKLLSGYVDGAYKPFDKDFTPMAYIKSINEGEDVKLEVNTESNFVTVKKQAYIANYVKYYDSEKAVYFSSTGNNQLTKKTEDCANGMGLDGDTAYIGIYLFEGNVSNGIEQVFGFIKNTSHKTKLILDLRNNGGGFMDDLQKVSSYLVKKSGDNHPLIAVAKNNKGKEEKFYASANNFYNDITKIVVLANENTASASECLIGAMLHYGMITENELIIEKNLSGTARTFGKGIMQTTFKNIFTSEAIKLTTAKIYLPDKTTSIHGVGFTTTAENGVLKGQAITRALEILA